MSNRDRILSRRYRRLRIEPLELRRVMSGIVRGDFNRDGQVTGADVPAMLAALANLRDYQTAQSLSAADLIQLADLNGDGRVDNRDTQGLFASLANQAASQLQPTIVRGDFNRDGQVTGADVSAMMGALANLSGYQTAQGLSAADLIQLADLNGDGRVDNRDIQGLFAVLANQAASNLQPTWFDTHVQTAAIRTLADSEYQDGVLSRNDMISGSLMWSSKRVRSLRRKCPI